jgi:CRP-like cAMP-binding protein
MRLSASPELMRLSSALPQLEVEESQAGVASSSANVSAVGGGGASAGGMLLTEEDWLLILGASQCVAYPANALVLSANESSRRMYAVARGSCLVVAGVVNTACVDRSPLGGTSEGGASASAVGVAGASAVGVAAAAESAVAGGEIATGGVVCVLKEGDTFGEEAFLCRAGSPNSVLTVGPTELYVIEGWLLNLLGVRHPGVSMRYLRFMAAVLVHRADRVRFDLFGHGAASRRGTLPVGASATPLSASSSPRSSFTLSSSAPSPSASVSASLFDPAAASK